MGRACFLSVVCLLAGCTAETEFATSQSRLLDEPDAVRVREVAQSVLRSAFPRLRVARDGGSIVCEPVEYRASRDSGSARDLVGAASTLRRSGVLNLSSQAGRTLARLRVDIERRETSQRAAFPSQDTRLGDSPAQTAIERDAGTTQTQNQVWVRVRRDRALERALLDDLQSRLAPFDTAPSGAAAPDATPPVSSAPDSAATVSARPDGKSPTATTGPVPARLEPIPAPIE